MNNPTPTRHSINIAKDGTLRFIYDETLSPLLTTGPATVQRASFLTEQENGEWMGNLAPVQGPTIGPFPTRALAIQAEREWIEKHWLPDPYPVLPCPL